FTSISKTMAHKQSPAKDRRNITPTKSPETNVFIPWDIILPLVVYKVFIYGFILLSLELLPPFFSYEFYSGNFHWPSNAQPTLETIFATWDAQMHLQLSYEGYKEDKLSIVQQPLWPF